MSRFSSAGFAAIAVASLAACSETSVSPGKDLDALDAPVFSANLRGPEQVMSGEVIVKLKDGSSEAAVANAHGLAIGERGYKNSFVVMRGNAGNEHANANALKNDSRVEYAEPNYLRQVDGIDSRLWAFYNPGGLNMTYTTGKSRGLPLPNSYKSKADADQDNIEGIAADGEAVIVGNIDTGVDLNHPEFAGRLIVGRDWYNNDGDPTDDDGHGSHTSGTMAGATVGVAGIAGAAPQVKIHVQKVCGRRGCPTSAIVNAIRAAADAGVVAMNVSIGGTSESQAEKDAIVYALNLGSLVIASAGNNGTGTVSCPACNVNAISVAASNWQDVLASYSNWGPGLDITAPGGNCYSNTSAEGCIYSAYLAGGYAFMQGTSMAAPQVTGVAAIVASKLGLRGTALRNRIEGTVDDLGTAGADNTFGKGRLNAYRAVTGNTLTPGL